MYLSIIPLPPQAVHGRGCPGIAKLHGKTSNECLINLPTYQPPPPKMLTNGTMMTDLPVVDCGLSRLVAC